jgi:hypothetical protein
MFERRNIINLLGTWVNPRGFDKSDARTKSDFVQIW